MREFNAVATGIGSLPHKDARSACDFVNAHCGEGPFWPQLPRRSFKENMYVQASEGAPCTVIDEERQTIQFDTSGDVSEILGHFYEAVLADDIDKFAITSDYAAGLYEFARRKETLGKAAFLKGQIIGPISFGMTVTDQTGRAILYNETMADVLVKHLAMKARWQIRFLKSLHANIVIFIDEPYLVSIGSAFVSLNRPDAVAKLDEVIEAIHSEGATCGIHCCGNTDWQTLMQTKADIISFDAYEHWRTLALFPSDVSRFLGSGALAWGIVPSSEAAEIETSDSLIERMNEARHKLIEKGVSQEALNSACLITPSCGTGTLTEGLAERIFCLANELSQSLKV